MATIGSDWALAEGRMDDVRQGGYAVSARYDARARRVVVELNSGVVLAVPARLIEGLVDAVSADLTHIEVSPAGTGLYWPALDVDVYVPALMLGVLGSRQWMAAQLGTVGGRSRTDAKAQAARENGRKGGRPRKAPGS